MTEKLLPCPFCLRPVTATGIQGGGPIYFLVGCYNMECAASDISCSPERWNTRATSAAAQRAAKRWFEETRHEVAIRRPSTGEKYALDRIAAIDEAERKLAAIIESELSSEKSEDQDQG